MGRKPKKSKPAQPTQSKPPAPAPAAPALQNKPKSACNSASRTHHAVKTQVQQAIETESMVQSNQRLETQDHLVASTGQQRQALRLSDSVGETLMPGDEFVVGRNEGSLVLGPGLQLKVVTDEESLDRVVSVNKAGVLVHRKPNTFYIDMNARSYLPYKHDDVVAVITKRSGDQYVVDIGTRDRVTLSKFAFEGATKKNKPELKIGDIVFARFMDVPSDFPFEISCVTASGKAMGHGPLEGGFLFQIPSPAVKVLQTSKKHGGSDIVKRLGQILPFEMTLGVNGYVWVKSKFDLANILISRTIEAAGNLPPEDHSQLLSSFRTSLEAMRGVMTSK